MKPTISSSLIKGLCVLTLCLTAALAIAQKRQHKLIKVLIVDGFSNHNWQQTTKVTKAILEESGRFEVSVSTAPATVNDTAWAKWSPQFNNYQLVIQNTNNIQNKAWRWPRAIEQQLETYVKQGGGLYILHSGNNAFPHWQEYDRMMGLGWRSKETGYALEIDSNQNIIRIPPGQGKGTGHGNRFDAVITALNVHPINKGFPRQWKTPSMEVDTYARGPAENTTVLSYAYDSVSTHKNWPVEWVIKYGKGRVYNSSMGHLWKDEVYPVSYRCIGFQTTLIRACEWLATGKVKYKVPENFPSKNKISIRAETDMPVSK